MDFEEKVKILREFPVFKVIPINEVRAIAFATAEKKISAKTTFINQGEVSDAIYLVVKGSARVFRLTEDGEEVSLSIAGVGDVIGEMALFSDGERSAYVEALTDSHFLTLKGSDLVKIMREYPEIAMVLFTSLSHKIKRVDQHVEDLVTKKLIDRTYSTLQLLSKYFENGKILMSHEELAQIIGATRAKISLALEQLEGEDKISLDHRKISLIEN